MKDADEFEEADPARQLDEQAHSWDSVGLHTRDTFTYVFDLGDRWEHGCTVLRDDAAPVRQSGEMPREIVPIFGWGTIPDQYGRVSPDEDESEQQRRLTRRSRVSLRVLPAAFLDSDDWLSAKGRSLRARVGQPGARFSRIS